MDTQTHKDRLAADMKLVMNDVEALLRSTANQANGEMEEWHSRLRDRVSDMKHRLGQMERSAADKARAAGRATDEYVHQHPWQSVGIAAGAGALVGVLLMNLRR